MMTRLSTSLALHRRGDDVVLVDSSTGAAISIPIDELPALIETAQMYWLIAQPGIREVLNEVTTQIAQLPPEAYKIITEAMDLASPNRHAAKKDA